MLLTEGTQAPEFTLPNQDEKNVSLSDFRGQKILLWFFPKASTPGWTVQGEGFRDEFNTFNQKNVQIIGVSADPPKKQNSPQEDDVMQLLQIAHKRNPNQNLDKLAE